MNGNSGLKYPGSLCEAIKKDTASTKDTAVIANPKNEIFQSKLKLLKMKELLGMTRNT